MLHKEEFAVMKALYQRDVCQTDIAAALDVHPKTVSPDLKRCGTPQRTTKTLGANHLL